jgi:hypothetical protein
MQRVQAEEGERSRRAAAPGAGRKRRREKRWTRTRDRALPLLSLSPCLDRHRRACTAFVFMRRWMSEAGAERGVRDRDCFRLDDTAMCSREASVLPLDAWAGPTPTPHYLEMHTPTAGEI